MDKSLMPECYADTLLIQTLVPPANGYGYNHKHSCNAVAKEMISGKFKDSFALGIIDNDKKVIPYLKQFEIVKKCESGIILWKHIIKHHYIIQIDPALEKWLLKICSENNISLEDHGLKNNLNELKRHTKSVTSLRDEKLLSLFEAIRIKAEDVTPVKRLITWVTLLRDKNYKISINELKDV